MQEAAELLRQMDPETRMGAKWPLHECCMNVATTSQIIYWLWCFEKEELRISLSTSRILSSSQYHWPWSVYCAAVWLYICTKPRKNPHASEHVSKHVCIEQLRACQSTLNRTKTCDTHIFCWCISHPCQYVNTYCAYIYTHTYSLYCTSLHLYMPNTVMFVHLSTSLQSPNKRCLPWPSSHGAGPPSFRFGRRLPPTRPHAHTRLCQKWGYERLNIEPFFEGIPFFKQWRVFYPSMVFQVFNGPPHKKPRLSNIALKRGPRNSPGLGTRPLRYKIVQRDKQPFWGEIGWAGQWRQARWGLLLKYVGPMKAGIALLRGWRGCPSQRFCVFLEMSYQLFFTSERKNMKKKYREKR